MPRRQGRIGPSLRWLRCSLLLGLLAAPLLQAAPLSVYTEEFPPFNFTRDGAMAGASTEVVEAILAAAKLDYQIISQPWARSFQQAQTASNALIYSISRNPERESLLQWIGVLVPVRHSLFALAERSDIHVQRLADLANYRIATQLNGARESHLLANGVPSSALLRLSGNQVPEQQYQMLRRGRIDLWPAADALAYHVVRSHGEQPQQLLRKVYTLETLSQDGYYLAASPTTPTATLARIAAALEALKQTTEYQQILQRWGLTQSTAQQ